MFSYGLTPPPLTSTMSSTAMRRKGLVIVNALIEKVDNSLVLKMPPGLWLKRMKWSDEVVLLSKLASGSLLAGGGDKAIDHDILLLLVVIIVIVLGSGLVHGCLAVVVRDRARGVRLDAHEGEAELLHLRRAEGGAGRDEVGGRGRILAAGRCLGGGSSLATRGLALAGLHILLVLPLELRVLADGVGDALGVGATGVEAGQGLGRHGGSLEGSRRGGFLLDRCGGLLRR